MAQKRHRLAWNSAHLKETHRRWTERGYHESDAERREPHPQCWNCIFYVALTGKFALDWGVCTNALFAMDGRALFEHDGCQHHVETTDR